MADETKRSPRSSSTGAARKSRAATAAAATAPAAAEKPDVKASSAAAAPEAPKAAAAGHAATPAVGDSAASGNGVALAGLIAGVLGIVLALTYPQWTPIVYGSSGSEKRVTADQVRAEMQTEIASLKATITSMEQAIRTAKLPGILMVAEDLRTALADSEPYAGTLNLFRALTGGDGEAAPIIAAIEGRAEVGVPTMPEVQDAFDEVAHAVLMAEQRPQTTGNLASQVSDTVASLAAATMRLRWRLDGAPTGDGVPAVVARAEQAVVNGELQTAIDTIGLLPEDRRALAQPWIEMVNARMQAEAVREELDAYIISMAARIQ